MSPAINLQAQPFLSAAFVASPLLPVSFCNFLGAVKEFGTWPSSVGHPLKSLPPFFGRQMRQCGENTLFTSVDAPRTRSRMS